MDYRSIIALSYENKQNALKEAKKKSGNSLLASSKQKGPSDDAVKRFLEKKKNDEIEWYKKIKVDKPPPPPKKSKESKKVKSKEFIIEEKKSDSQPQMQEKIKKKSEEHSEKSAPKRPSSSSNSKESGNKKIAANEEIAKKSKAMSSISEKSSINCANKKSLKKENSEMSSVSSNNKESNCKKSDSKSSFVPSFSNYNKILEMANRNAENPPKFVANPDCVKTDGVKQKRKSEKIDPLFESQFEISVPKKRKLTNDGNDKVKQKSDSDAFIKKKNVEENTADARKQPVVNKNIDKVYSKSPKSTVNITKKSHSSSTSSKQKSDSDAFIKKKKVEENTADARKQPVVNKNVDKVYSKSPKINSSITNKSHSSSISSNQRSLEKVAPQTPSVPVKRGIAAQLSNNVSFSRPEDVRANSMSPACSSKPKKPSHISEMSDKESSRNSSAKQKLTPESSRVSSTSSAPKKEVTMETKVSSKNKVKNASKTPESVKKSIVSNGMSVTMEDDDSDFMHISRKRDSKAPPLAAPAPPRRGIAAQSGMDPPRRGIAAQSGMSSGPPIRRGIAAQNSAFESSYMKSRPFRPCIDTDEEEEDDYDEDDDFIDDTELVTDTQYKSYVQEIHQTLRFDPSKYEKIKPWDDLRSMESNFKDIQKEEKRSARLGMKEDLADIKAEEERVAKKKKKKKR